MFRQVNYILTEGGSASKLLNIHNLRMIAFKSFVVLVKGNMYVQISFEIGPIQ